MTEVFCRCLCGANHCLLVCQRLAAPVAAFSLALEILLAKQLPDGQPLAHWTAHESQLRMYWEKSVDNCIIRQCTGEFDYGHEYMGLNGRLVITPLTDRCASQPPFCFLFDVVGQPFPNPLFSPHFFFLHSGPHPNLGKKRHGEASACAVGAQKPRPQSHAQQLPTAFVPAVWQLLPPPLQVLHDADTGADLQARGRPCRPCWDGQDGEHQGPGQGARRGPALNAVIQGGNPAKRAGRIQPMIFISRGCIALVAFQWCQQTLRSGQGIK